MVTGREESKNDDIDPVLLNPNFFKIQYFVPHPDQDLTESSYFQGFTPGILETARLFDLIPYLPSDVRELYATRDVILQHRILGRLRYWIAPIQITSLSIACETIVNHRTPFVCILSYHKIANEVDRLIKELGFPVFHISTEHGNGRVVLEDSIRPVRGAMYRHVDQLLRHLRRTNADPRIVTEIEEVKKSKSRLTRTDIGLSLSHHNVTHAGERMLDSLGYDFEDGSPIRPSLVGDAPYLEHIFRVHDAIVEERTKRVGADGRPSDHVANSLVVTLPSLMTFHYGTPDLHGVDVEYREELELIHQHFSKQRSFAVTTNSARFLRILESESARAIISLRQTELAAYTAAVTIAACNEFLPVLRLSPKINGIRARLRQIGDCARGSNPHQEFKLNRLAGQLATEMEASVDQGYLDRIDAPKQKVKIIADLPLEWLPIRGLPLMLRYDCSRYPTTPGNVLLAQCLSPPEIFVSSAAFKEVLVVRSYKDDDRIRFSLEAGIKHITDDYSHDRFRVRFVDVATEDEFCDSVNSFKGAILIFDGHGHSGGRDGIGGIIIGGKTVDVWSLRKKIRVPPIVILSACDTFALDGSHASPANGFLVLGARTVLATLLPIAANLAAVYIARLMLRVAEFIPIVTHAYDHKIRWSKVVSGFQRMSYVTELVRAINGRKGCQLSVDDVSDIGLLANMHINTDDEAWYERVIEEITNRSGSSETVVKDLVERWAKLTDTLRYIQLGSPETITIINKSLEELTSPKA